MFVFPVFLVFGANAASAQWGATRMDLGQRAKALAPVIRVTPPTSPIYWARAVTHTPLPIGNVAGEYLQVANDHRCKSLVGALRVRVTAPGRGPVEGEAAERHAPIAHLVPHARPTAVGQGVRRSGISPPALRGGLVRGSLVPAT